MEKFQVTDIAKKKKKKKVPKYLHTIALGWIRGMNA